METDAQRARLDRALRALTAAPETPVVKMSTATGLAFAGTVDHRWMVQARSLIPRLGVGKVDLSGLADRERAESMQRSRKLPAAQIKFLPNQAKVAASRQGNACDPGDRPVCKDALPLSSPWRPT